MRYLIGTMNYGIKFTREKHLRVFVDADYVGDLESRKSTLGFLMTIGNAPTNWYSKLQKCVSTSTAESEYYSLSECSKHSIWYMTILKELNININFIIINVDNREAIYNCQNNSINPKSKHIDIKYHHVSDLIKENKIKLSYIRSENNLTDGFTKNLNNSLMDKFRKMLLKEIKES